MEDDSHKNRKIVIVDNFDHIPGVNEATIDRDHVKISGDTLEKTGWQLAPYIDPNYLNTPDKSEGFSRLIPQGSRYFISPEDIQKLAKDASKNKDLSGHPGQDATNVFVSHNSIWTANPDEPILEENVTQYNHSRKIFLFVLAMAWTVGLLHLILLYTWVFHFGDQHFASKNATNITEHYTKKKFQHYYKTHALIMATTIFVLQGGNTVIWRVFPHVSKSRIKYIHASLGFIGVVGSVVGVYFPLAVLHERRQTEKNVRLGLHGCIGIIVVALLQCQFLFGFTVFLLPYTSFRHQIKFASIHRFFGSLTFLLAVTTVVTGIVTICKMLIPLSVHSRLPPVSIVINGVGLLTVVYGMLTTVLFTDQQFRRRPRPYHVFERQEDILSLVLTAKETIGRGGGEDK